MIIIIILINLSRKELIIRIFFIQILQFFKLILIFLNFLTQHSLIIIFLTSKFKEFFIYIIIAHIFISLFLLIFSNLPIILLIFSLMLINMILFWRGQLTKCGSSRPITLISSSSLIISLRYSSSIKRYLNLIITFNKGFLSLTLS